MKWMIIYSRGHRVTDVVLNDINRSTVLHHPFDNCVSQLVWSDTRQESDQK